MKSIYLILVLFIVPAFYCQAQYNTRILDKTEMSSFASLGIRYNSDYFYMGRSDSVKAPYVIPSMGYYHKSGLFIRTSLSYLVAENENRVDLITLSGGYDYFGKKVASGISVHQYFFSDQSYSVQSEMSTYVTGYVGYDFNVFMLIAEASLGISDNYDVFSAGEISRTFYLLHDRILITPSFLTNFGTQQYYNEYYSKRSLTTGNKAGGGRGHGPGSGNGTSVPVTNINIIESEKFQVLDYELALQMSYKVKNLRFTTSGTFLFPVNPSIVVTESGSYEEDLTNGFVWSVGVRYKISRD